MIFKVTYISVAYWNFARK